MKYLKYKIQIIINILFFIIINIKFLSKLAQEMQRGTPSWEGRQDARRPAGGSRNRRKGKFQEKVYSSYLYHFYFIFICCKYFILFFINILFAKPED